MGSSGTLGQPHVSHSAGATTPPKGPRETSIFARTLTCNGGPHTEVQNGTCVTALRGIICLLTPHGVSAQLLLLYRTIGGSNNPNVSAGIQRVPCVSPTISTLVEESLIPATEISQLNEYTASTPPRPKVGADGGTGTQLVHALTARPLPTRGGWGG